MSNYILKYSRDERVKYISHLDFVRLFHRTVRRTGMNFMFSNGFNPHPIMMVAQPLSVGVTSDCEYMKVGFDGDYSEQELVDTINNTLRFKIIHTAYRNTHFKHKYAVIFAYFFNAIYIRTYIRLFYTAL